MARTMQYMQAFLASKGYNQAVLSPQVTTDTINNEWRTKLTMWVNLNKKTILDTITFALNQPALQKLALANKVNSYLKKGDAFSNENVNNELDRLVELFRSNGYYYFTKEKIFAEIDTVDQSLMQLKLDPLDQMNQLIAANQNKEKNPSWKVNIQLRNTNASTTKVYPIGQQIFYSDLKLSDNPDSILVNSLPQTEILDDISQSFTHPKFKSSLFAEQAILKKGELFNEPKFYQTLNKLSNLGAWQQIDARTTIQNDSVYLHYFLVPYLRRSFSFDLEGSRNTSQLSAGNLLGLSANVTYRDKNVLQKSIPSITSFRTGIELNVNNNNENLTQTLLWNVGHTYSFPSLLIPFKDKNTSNNNNARTNFSLNSAYTVSYTHLRAHET
jgi:outer membrane protein insertion porin family